MSYNPGDVLKDKYIIKEVLGHGSMGEVYRAEHVTIHRQFAIKLMHVHIAEKTDALARFRREASAAAQLEHPHICQVTDFDSTESGDFYLVMEYLNGETLRDRLKRHGTIEIRSVFRIMDDLLSALECAHLSGIVHRDVKPENISLISRDDRDDYVKLIDFGIAHADKPDDEHGTLTQSGQVYGTPQYLSPEQVMGDHVDFRADLYSCGCLLFEMLAGTPPFDGDNYVLLLNKHLVLDPPHLPYEYECSGELDEVIQKLLKKHPEDRYGSARDVRIALADIANRFDPSINLYMSQNGGTVPSLSNAQSVGSSFGSSNGMSSISNPYVNPKEISLLQTLGSKMKSSWHSQNNDAISRKNKSVTIAIVAGIVAIILGVGLFMIFSDQTDSEIISRLDPNGYIVSDEQLREFAKTECRITEADPIYQDESLRTAIQDCAEGKFEESYSVLDQSKNPYKDSMRVFIISLIESYAVKRYRDSIREALQLVVIEPAAVCTPAVREIIYSLYDDDVTYSRLHTGFMNLFDPPGTAESLSWLLLMMPCDKNQKRFERLYDSIKYSTESFAEKYKKTWLGMAVDLWNNAHAKNDCSIKETVNTIVVNELEKECNGATGKTAESARCSMCYPLWKKK